MSLLWILGGILPRRLKQRIAARIGQQNPVHIYKIVTEETIEDKVINFKTKS